MRTIIGLAILLVVILGLVWYVQRDSSFMSNLFNRSDSGESTEEGKGQDQQTGEESPDSAGTTPETMLTCTPELFAMDCAAAQDPVCSVDTVIRADGSESTSRTEYISACHYCKFFGPDNVMDFGDEKVRTQGYTVGTCTASPATSDQKGGN